MPGPEMGAPKLSPTSTKWKKRWSHQQTKSPRAYGARSTALLFLYLIGHHLLQHVVCCQQSSTSLSKGVPISELRGWSVFYILTYLDILFLVISFFSFVKFVYFFEIPRKTSMHRLKFRCLLLMPLFLLCSITLLQTTTTYSSVFPLL